MLQRIITGAVALIIFIPVLFLSSTIVFNIVIGILSFVGVYEMLRCTGHLKHWFLATPALMYSIAGPLLARTRFSTSYGLLLSITLIFMFLLLFIHVFKTDKINTSDISTVFMTTVYITVAFTSIIKLRDVANIGGYIYLYIFIGAWVTDTFAYFSGRFFGRHKLIPKVSPKKTVEGSLGGIIFCALAFVLYSFILERAYGLSPNYVLIFIIGAIISVISQLGDLAASAIKRNYGIKDFGSLFPGHGGVLDRFDSILAVTPILFMLIGNIGVANIFNQ